MSKFQYDAEILARFPELVGGVILAEDLSNSETPGSLLEAYLNEQHTALGRIGQTPLGEIESLAAWRRAFRAFGVNPTKYRSAPEALLRRLTKKGDIPSINTLVDLGNLVSIRYALPVAILDTRTIQGALMVHFADGSERFMPLGQDEIEHPDLGEAVFSDETKRVLARRWCWRQSDDSAATADTTGAVITVEAQHATGRVDVESALDALLGLLQRYTGGRYTSAVLDANQPSIATSA